MTQLESLALVRRYYEAFNRNDIAAMAECLSDDVAHDVNQGKRRIGKEAFRTFSEQMSKCYAEKLQNLVFFVNEAGTRAAVEFEVNGIYKATDSGLPPARGQHYLIPAGAFLDISEGEITRVTTYYNLQQWLDIVKAA